MTLYAKYNTLINGITQKSSGLLMARVLLIKKICQKFVQDVKKYDPKLLEKQKNPPDPSPSREYGTVRPNSIFQHGEVRHILIIQN